MSLVECIINRLSHKAHRCGAWKRYEAFVGRVSASGQAGMPDFMCISSSPTDAAWLRDCLSRHIQVCMPHDDHSYFCGLWRWLDINQYLRGFDNSHMINGDWGDGLAILPEFAIATIAKLIRRLKLVFLLRYPPTSTWIHILHDYRFRVGAFEGAGPEDDIRLSRLLNNGWMDYYIAFSDYYSILSRWLVHFPPTSIHISFIDHEEESTSTILAEVLSHVSAKNTVPVTTEGGIPIPGENVKIRDDFREYLERAFAERITHLNALLRDMFEISAPDNWRSDFTKCNDGTCMRELGRKDDPALMELLDRRLRHACLPRLVEEHYLGFNIIIYRGRFHALACGLGELDLHSALPAELRRLLAQGHYLVAETLHEIKQLVRRHARYACIEHAQKTA